MNHDIEKALDNIDENMPIIPKISENTCSDWDCLWSSRISHIVLHLESVSSRSRQAYSIRQA